MLANNELTPSKKELVLHPLMLSVKNLQYETALRLLSIMVKNSQRAEAQTPNVLDLNMKDENRNTIMHHVFMNFSVNMELSVELCQELLK